MKSIIKLIPISDSYGYNFSKIFRFMIVFSYVIKDESTILRCHLIKFS